MMMNTYGKNVFWNGNLTIGLALLLKFLSLKIKIQFLSLFEFLPGRLSPGSPLQFAQLYVRKWLSHGAYRTPRPFGKSRGCSLQEEGQGPLNDDVDVWREEKRYGGKNVRDALKNYLIEARKSVTDLPMPTGKPRQTRQLTWPVCWATRSSVAWCGASGRHASAASRSGARTSRRRSGRHHSTRKAMGERHRPGWQAQKIDPSICAGRKANLDKRNKTSLLVRVVPDCRAKAGHGPLLDWPWRGSYVWALIWKGIKERGDGRPRQESAYVCRANDELMGGWCEVSIGC
jgi:hypothetical protein